MNHKIEKFVRAWFTELTGDDQHYDIPTLGGEDYDVHYTLESFAEELVELIREAEAAAIRGVRSAAEQSPNGEGVKS